jgi:hypothetical protein
LDSLLKIVGIGILENVWKQYFLHYNRME